MADYNLEFTPAGIVKPDTSVVRAAIAQLFIDAFGTNLNTDPSTPQGQLITSITAIVNQLNQDLIDIFNSFNPRVATSPLQDAMAQVYFLTRKQGTPSRANVTLTGLEGTIVPAGTQFKDSNDNYWTLDSDVAIPAGGVATAQVICTVNGDVTFLVDTINSIVNYVQGLQNVSNDGTGTIGTNDESRANFDARINASARVNAQGLVDSLAANLRAIPDVRDANVIENVSDYVAFVKQVPMNAHSIAIIIDCPDDATLNNEIAGVIYTKKGTSPNTRQPSLSSEVSVQYPILDSGANAQFYYYRPEERSTYLYLSIAAYNNAAVNVRDQIIDICVKSMTEGYGDTPMPRIGEPIYTSRFNTALASIPGITIRGVAFKASTDADDVGVQSITPLGNEKIILNTSDASYPEGIILEIITVQ